MFKVSRKEVEVEGKKIILETGSKKWGLGNSSLSISESNCT